MATPSLTAARTLRSASRSTRPARRTPALKDDGLAVEPEDLAIDVRELAQAHGILDGVDEHRHHVAAVTTGLRALLEARRHLLAVARGLHPLHPLDLLQLHPLVDPEIVDRALLGHRVLVHADDDLLSPVLHDLRAVGGVGDLRLRVAAVDRAHDAAEGADLPAAVQRDRLHPFAQALKEVAPPERATRQRHGALACGVVPAARGA